MFRHSRSTEPDPLAGTFGRALKPLPVTLWGGQAMHFLGVPIVLGVCRASRCSFEINPALTGKYPYSLALHNCC